MKINLEHLVNLLNKTESIHNPITFQISDYLKNEVVEPLLKGKPIYLSDIDFGGFSMDELEELRSYLAESANISNELSRFCGDISHIQPQAMSTPSFC